MRKPLIAMLAVVAVVLAAAVFVTYRTGTPTAAIAAKSERPAQAAARVVVETAKARAATMTADIRAVGSLQSEEAVTIAPEIAGRIAEIPFAEGKPVKKGDVLLKLDDALAQAELAQAKARLDLAKANLGRATRLASTGAGSTQDRDEAAAEFATASAAIQLATVRQAQHTIVAPFDGVIGLRSVSVGAFVNTGVAIVNLEKIDTLKVDFQVPETVLSKIAVGQAIEVAVDAVPDRTFAGTIYAINPLLDVNGRALSVRGRLPNPDLILRPGLFARIVIKGLGEETAVLVPESALVPRGGDVFVYRIDGGKAVETKVQLGERKEGLVAIIDGIMADAEVVTAGQQKLRNGSMVEVVPPQPAKG